jgi:hypothetical protein
MKPRHLPFARDDMDRTVSRRSALAGTAGLAALLTGAAPHASVASTPMAEPARPDQPEPTVFTLTGDGTRISYSTSSIAGVPLFSYADDDVRVDAEGDEIVLTPVRPSQSWALGTLVSVYVDAAPDAWARTLTLVLPEIHLAGGGETPFSTIAIMTRHLTTFGGTGLVEGQLQEYDVMPLDGTALFAVF